MIWGDSRLPAPGKGVWRALCAALTGGLCLLGAPAVSAQNVATASGNARVVVVAPLSLVKNYDMDFGKILPTTTAGTMTVSPVTNACTATGGLRNFDTCRAAQFVGMGTRNMTARITMSGITTLTGPGAPMNLTAFLVGQNPTIQFIGNTNGNGNGNGLLNGNGNQRYRIMANSGIFWFNIGATLGVNANQTPGLYTGSFSVTVQYN